MDQELKVTMLLEVTILDREAFQSLRFLNSKAECLPSSILHFNADDLEDD